MAQVYGYLDILAYSGATQEFLLTSGRPGGFLNPNESSCIAIVLLHTIYTEKVNSKNYIYIITFATAICLLIVLLSQSRAAIIFLSLLLFFNINIRYLFIFLLSLIIFNLIYENEIIYDLFDNLVLRFYGDYSSEERGGLIFSSIESFMQSPLYGNGADYLVNKFGYASHNQLLDILSSYGIVGLIFITVSVALIYIPCSASFVFFCITPFFLFSHNFFNSISFGAIMGISLAFNRFHKIYYQSKNSIYIL
jgi:O-antigen ligase